MDTFRYWASNSHNPEVKDEETVTQRDKVTYLRSQS